MSLLKRKQERDRKAAEESVRLAEEKKRQDLAAHPMLKDGSGRDLCDAYFHGIVFAAFADDDKLDEGERLILNDIGGALGLPSQDIQKIIACVQSLPDDGKLSLLDESVNAIKGNETTVKLFYAQFAQIWTSHEHDEGELFEYLLKFAEWTEVEMPKAVLGAIKVVLSGGDGVDEKLFALSEWMGEAALKYFVVKQYGDVTETLIKVRKREKDAEERQCHAKAEKTARGKAQQLLNELLFSTGPSWQEKKLELESLISEWPDLVSELDF